MTEETKAGRIGPHRESHEPRLDATKFVTATPSAYVEWDGTVNDQGQPIDLSGVDGNDVWGDCGPTATDKNNCTKVGDHAAYGQLGMPKFAGTLGTYWAYGLAQGETGQPPNQPDQPDNGVDNASWFGFLYKNGIIDGYGEVPLTALDQFAATGHGLVVGLQINDQQAIDDFNSGRPWDVMENITGGHDTLLVKLHTDGTGSLLTWGKAQPFTVAFRNHNFTDAWIIWDKDDPSVDWTALQAALDEVHGVLGAAPTDVPRTPESTVQRVLKEAEEYAQKIVHAVEEIPESVQKHSAFLSKFEDRIRQILGKVLTRSTEDALTNELKRLLEDVLKKEL